MNRIYINYVNLYKKNNSRCQGKRKRRSCISAPSRNAGKSSHARRPSRSMRGCTQESVLTLGKSIIRLHSAEFALDWDACSIILFGYVVQYVRAPLLNIHLSRSTSVSMTSCGPMSANMRVAGTPSVRYAINRIIHLPC